MRRIVRSLLILAAAAAILACLLALNGILILRASLPRLEGTQPLPGLGGPVTVARDAQGVPSIEAGSPEDAARALGFVHAQERFFQMDLLRRRGAGELAELIGPAALALDQRARAHEIRRRARDAEQRLRAEEQRWLDAYTQGVNAGLEALRIRPPEYLLLRQRPRAWQSDDSLAVMMAMAFVLQDADGLLESRLGVLRQSLSPAAFEFFAPRGTEWDAAVDDHREPPPSVPTPEEFTAPDPPDSQAPVAGLAPGGASAPLREFSPGSNAWAVHGSRTRTGAALVADDMHLDLAMPNIWFRAVLQFPSGAGAPRRLSGVTLPGIPYLVTGSNGDIAWGFTNAQVDESDVIELETDAAAHSGQYLTPDGWKSFEVRVEQVPVAGANPVATSYTNTVWGPVMDLGIRDGRLRAVRWIYHEPGAWNIHSAAAADLADVGEAMRWAPQNAIPIQNLVVGDRRGNIGWTLTGPLPRRIGFDGRLPASWADGTRRWDGIKAPEQYPSVVNPPGGLLWTANQRVAGSPAYRDAGDGFPDNGARAGQIRDDLRTLRFASATDMLAIQLDDRATFFDRWQHLLLKTLERPTGTNAAAFDAIRPLVRNWGGRASPDSVGFRLVLGFRNQVEARVAEPVVQLCRPLCPEFFIPGSQFEQPLLTLLQERPPHLLNRRFASWEALLESAAGEVAAAAMQYPGGVNEFTWGRRQTFQMRHPISHAVPTLGRWLDLPAEELPGAPFFMPRIQGRDFGASERFSVSPGLESDGLFHMPGGQGGHFLSPYYRAGHQAWARGDATPFLPGPTRHRLVLKP
ncbi:MAG: penicillin acylase family protein [Verrucomicrobiae bacterium]|nr:penicillin acylase family protein [Verrucomicrobiae bacterium]